MIPRWYKEAIIYCLDVETFQDSNGDGVGDFAGLTQRLDHLAGMGVTCIWLLPFFPTPNRDNGYDILDYYGVDERLGNLGDFANFTRRARDFGMHVIIDLVVNHTSDQHPWFQQALRDRNSAHFDYYVWSAERPANADQGMIFPGPQESVWTYAEEVDAYYFHRFYRHQPDLNIANPAVQDEISKIMGFWLQLGISGFRLDAAPFLIEMRGIDGEKALPDPYDYLVQLREELSWRKGDAILLAEANVSNDKILCYFGEGNRMHMLFNFIANQHLFLAMARQQAEPLVRGIQRLPAIPARAQWAQFLRNHDELDLDRLSPAERSEISAAFNFTEDMWIYNRGVRRRLAPILQGDQRRIELAISLLFTLNGTPVLRYGQEIGMGDNLELWERRSVRTPMQWSNERNGGFSTAPEEDLLRPVISGGRYGYQRVNVTVQQREPDSLLNRVAHMIHVRKTCREFAYGTMSIIETDDPAVMAHSCTWNGGCVVGIHNFSDRSVEVHLKLEELAQHHLIDLLANRPLTDEDERYESGTFRLDPYGYRWIRVGQA